MGDNTDVSLLGRGRSAKGLQPRVVLCLLVGASLAGVWVTHAADPLSSRIVAWLVVVAVGPLAGGLYWRVVLFGRDAFETPGHWRHVRAQWRRVEAVLVWGLSLAGVAHLALDGGSLGAGIGAVALGTGLVAAPLLWVGIRSSVDDAAGRKTAFRAGLLLAACVSLGGFAWLETGTNILDWAVRLGHLGAFSLWIGGAIWHNFVVLPTVRARPDAAASVKSQARAFRRHLPVVIALLAATGSYQTDRLVGLSAPALFGSHVGHLVGVKLVVLIALTGLVIVSHRRNP